jgi:hypothetical protein
MPTVRIRPAVHEDLPTLRDIEWASGQRYRDYGLDHVADDEPAPLEVLARCADDGRAWVAVDNSDQPIGYILVDIIDGGGHIEQVSVAPRLPGTWGWPYLDRARPDLGDLDEPLSAHAHNLRAHPMESPAV